MKSNQKKYYEALRNLGGEATTKQIAENLGICTKGINQTLNAIKEIKYLSRRVDQSRWKIIS